MKNTAISLGLLFMPLFLDAQVVFAPFTSFDALLQQATAQQKLIFIQIKSDKCPHCNDIATKSLSSNQLQDKYQVNFISTQIEVYDSTARRAVEKLGVEEMIGSIYLDAKGNILFKSLWTSPFPLNYTQWADKAIENSYKITNLQTLTKTYQNGDKSLVFLEKYIRALNEMGRNTDTIAEEFARKLTLDAFRNHQIIKLIKEQGLSIHSPALKVVHAINDGKIIDSIWYTMPNSKRVAINNRTIKQTLSEAVKAKNRELLYGLDDFITAIYYGSGNRHEGSMVSQMQILNYYRLVKDTVNTIRVGQYAAMLIMDIKIDTIKAEDKRMRDLLEKDAANTFVPPSSRFANNLNDIAWEYYLMTNDTVKLIKALKWSKQSIDIYQANAPVGEKESSAFLDTYAHLLYKLKRYEEAIEWQSRAINAHKSAGMSPDNLEKEREKMNTRRL